MLLGMLLSETIVKHRDRLCKWYLAVAAGIVAVILYCTENTVIGNTIDCVLMLYAMLTLAVRLSECSVECLKYVGEHAFTIYLYSWPIQAVIEFILVVIMRCPWYMAFPCMFMGGLVGPLVMYEVYIRFLPKNKFLNAMIGV